MISLIAQLPQLLLLCVGLVIGFAVGVFTMSLLVINQPDEDDEHGRGL